MSTTPRPLILASTSRYRAELLGRLRLPFNTASPGVDETAQVGEAPADLAGRLAREKALAVASLVPDGLVIGSDQVADCGGQVLGKPGTAENAVAQLKAASGRTVTFWTAIALADAVSGEVREALVRCDVEFRILGDAEISRYVAIEQPLDCAGSFRCEGLGIALFRRILTDDPTSLVGLPLIALCELLRETGVVLPEMAQD